ncbi:DUF3405 domain-containing protein [Longitalea luteola]|uniref:DUF3405 domain-containing protein n=1 Tax=Longitalea luteola TaxID=2812563 RepID=UPI001A964046|nr:DUF3405 domain-containing protein [Longitalea luteola]
MISSNLVPAARQVFLLLSNNCTPRIMHLFNQISAAAAHLGDSFLLYHQTEAVLPAALNSNNSFSFCDNILTGLHYLPVSATLIPGNNHFPLLHFYRQHPGYDFYWFIEDDVRFNGPWENLFNYFTAQPGQPDFISSHVRRFDEEPNWYWWNTLQHVYTFIPLHLRIRSFNPIYRISNAALNCIHSILYADKWRGHHEVLLPTLLSLEGLHIADFGGVGQFVPEGCMNKFYVDDHCDVFGAINAGTMRYRPLIENLQHADKLYHPVKE